MSEQSRSIKDTDTEEARHHQAVKQRLFDTQTAPFSHVRSLEHSLERQQTHNKLTKGASSKND